MAMSAPASKLLSAMVEARTGQRFEAAGNWRIEVRLGDLMARHGIGCPDELCARILERNGAALAQDVIDAVLNNETSFFRDKDVFRQVGRFLTHWNHILAPGRPLRIWSAGCSTGQEVYSLAMLIADELKDFGGRPVELLGTDVSVTAVDRALRGEFSRFEIQRGLPVRQMLRWFEQSDENWCIDPKLREKVRFRRHNLLDSPPAGFFHLILCRNVLLYFPGAAREQILARLADALVPGGGLILGAGETVLGRSERFAIVDDLKTIYTLKPDRAEPVARLG